jgi:tetratricopeptide (TPR) repeat protein
MPRNSSATATAVRTQSESATSAALETGKPPLLVRFADAGLLLLFLGLVFLLGVFPLKDTDFWWHLRTGDLIRQGWRVPVTDWYTFGAAEHSWIDLHWGFEVLLSWGYQHFGVSGLNLAKCAITTGALVLLLTARHRNWPLWVMVLAWLPALFVLSGRMYVRPETLTLLYLSIFLAVLIRWDRYPRLAWILPVVELLWVNTQGLFVFGLVLLGFAIIDAALTRGGLSKARRPWWRAVAIPSGLTVLACVLNPYGLLGALFPIQLARTMSDDVFSQTIAELMPVPAFIEDMGFRSLPLQLHLATMALGALSFVIPIVWMGSLRLMPARSADAKPSDSKRRRRKTRSKPAAVSPPAWKLSYFRLLLFLAFSVLSWKATRNSHQFAAVVGCVTAWNFGEWAAALRQRKLELRNALPRFPYIPRLATIGCLILALVAVGSGKFYLWAAEGRTIGLGEEPLWFPHAAARFAGRPEMPSRFVCFHNGHSALYEYYNGPERKVFADARLEVIGPELHRKYIDLDQMLRTGRPGWSQALMDLGSPGVLVDTVQQENAGRPATLLASSAWRCVWFDPIAAVFVPSSSPAARHPVDFAARLFQPEAGDDGRDIESLRASARILNAIALDLVSSRRQPDVAAPLILLGLHDAQRLRDAEPSSFEGWKYTGLLEATREQVGDPEDPVPRFRMPFDPIFDLSAARATYALEQTLARAPEDSKSLLTLAFSYQSRGMDEAAEALWERLATLVPPNQRRSVNERVRGLATAQAARLKARMGSVPSSRWQNQDELNRAVEAYLASGRAAGAYALLTSAYGPDARPWDVADRMATIQLHLGNPAEARSIWQSTKTAPRPAVKGARVAATYLAESNFAQARRGYEAALEKEPRLFEAHYGLAVLERDAGHADAALGAALRATEVAPTDPARKASQAILTLVQPYAKARATAAK